MSKKKTKYTLAHKGLSQGHHRFEFEIGDALFEAIPESEIKKGEGLAVIDLQKGANLLQADVQIQGQVQVQCDRCLEEFYMPVDFHGKLLVKFSEAVQQQQLDTDTDADTEVIWLHPSEDLIDLSQYFYDSISLSLPLQRVHPLDTEGRSLCNEFMLSQFQIAEDDYEELEDVEEDEE